MNNMTNDEQYQTKLHWIIYLNPILLLGIPLLFSFLGLYQPMVIGIFVIISLGWGIAEYIRYQFTSLTVKPRQVVFKTGVLVQQTIDLPMGKIETIDVRQTIVGTLFNYGDIIITGSGGSRQVMGPIASPLTARRYIEQFLNTHKDL